MSLRAVNIKAETEAEIFSPLVIYFETLEFSYLDD